MTQGTWCFEKALGGLVATVPLWTDFRVCNRANSHQDLPTPSHMRRNGPTWTVHTRQTPFTLSPTSSRILCSNMYIFPLLSHHLLFLSGFLLFLWDYQESLGTGRDGIFLFFFCFFFFLS